LTPDAFFKTVGRRLTAIAGFKASSPRLSEVPVRFSLATRSGATLIAHLARSRPDLPVGGALLVAPADPDLNPSRLPGLATFAPLPLAPFLFPAIVVASSTDPFMALERAQVIAKMWEAEFVDDSVAGPMAVSSRRGAWPEGRTLLERLRAPRGYLRPALRSVAGGPQFNSAPVSATKPE
jgi:hypothetical protein